MSCRVSALSINQGLRTYLNKYEFVEENAAAHICKSDECHYHQTAKHHALSPRLECQTLCIGGLTDIIASCHSRGLDDRDRQDVFDFAVGSVIMSMEGCMKSRVEDGGLGSIERAGSAALLSGRIRNCCLGDGGFGMASNEACHSYGLNQADVDMTEFVECRLHRRDGRGRLSRHVATLLYPALRQGNRDGMSSAMSC